MTKSPVIDGKGQYINGQWTKGNGTTLESINPGYGTLLWKGTSATEQDVSAACHAARQALFSWSFLDFEQRANYTKRFAQQIEKNHEQLAHLIALETGKPLWEAHTEVKAVIGKINLSIQAYHERTWTKTTQTAEANTCLRFKPQGVVVVLGAFNFPAHLSNGHIVPALLAGNTVLYKPSEHAPAVAELIMQCWHESDIPPGVINCLQGDATCGKALLTQDVQGVYFTGSYATGLRIHQHFSSKPEVILALEMGGNNPLIIDKVTDLNAAVYHTLLSTVITAGQRCTCARRIIIPDSQQGDEFLNRFIQTCASIKVAPFDQKPEPFIGPVISHTQALQHIHSQKKLIELGGVSLLDMNLLADHTGLLSPGIIDMTHVKNPPDEEIFAPLVQIYRYTRFEQAIDLANQTRYGLVAGLFSNDEQHYHQFYEQVRAGLINWNKPTTGAASSLPFGGVGLSGNHRPSAYFAADYCAYPVASMEQPVLTMPEQILPGIVLE
ncbi:MULTISPECIES: succinylglutamate-semialdehyde dehydrogenase [Legionella]|uniref:N-succinylglutamate 5-semialdehyde dehydrogenase n=1 Tax=Legionella resiliens TaxID=2905958 RepID=A0ABS8X2L8_9GAMM|nr:MULTISPECIES: succinylglutamate-semialdehyde dehydrogenase [unclassified Legionella]MCE0723836.1 succinylglutamate-semialdehyde dehydrogenase [Legionella sp. 9fVS26]MCE3532988.1 succinylglutamate-semialdehyde dehydrogenase [Legionella sp. 8cVS16]QLZ69179.1 succinylglutamate-semialdehyde dehydrogenase [Legionella sp. PC1000]